MRILAVCIIYAVIAALLGSIAVKTFFNIKTKDDPLHRQYFFTVLILLFILLVSFIAVLLKLAVPVAIGTASGSEFFIGYSDESGFNLIGFIIIIIIGITAIALFDRYVLKRRSKTEREYRIRRRLAIGGLILLIGIITVIRLVR